MKKRIVCAVIMTALALGVHAAGSAAVDALKKGDFDAALRHFEEEMAKRPGDANLKKNYRQLRTAMRRQELFDRESDPEILQNLAKPLRGFYYRFGLYKQAAAVDRRVYKMLPEPQNAVAYAVSLLNLDENAEAAKIFDTLKPDDLPAGAQLCAALAYARTGRAEAADAIRAKFPADKLKAGMLPLAARIAAVRGDAAASAMLTRRILEGTPEKQHEMLKKQLFGAKDFSGIAATAEFQEALKTASKLGNECATCPNRGTAKCDHENDPDHKCEHGNDPNHKCEHDQRR